MYDGLGYTLALAEPSDEPRLLPEIDSTSGA
jgi:hypothetical protein